MGARRRRLNKHIVFGEELAEQPDPFQPESKEKSVKYKDTNITSASAVGTVLSILAFLAVGGWAFLMVVHSTISS